MVSNYNVWLRYIFNNMEIYKGTQAEGSLGVSNAAKDVTEHIIQPISGSIET